MLERDGVPVRDNPDLRDQLTAYLRDEQPLAACSYCLGCVGKSVPLRQMNKAAALQWLSEKDPEVRELIDWDEVANAQPELERPELTGLLPGTTRRRMRWLITLWAKRLLGLELKQSF